MNTELQAQQLAEWLDNHPENEPPADLDPEVVEALYVLRPDLAPAPRVTVDELLAGLTTGPFASMQPIEGATDDLAAPTLSSPIWDPNAYATDDEVDEVDESAPTEMVRRYVALDAASPVEAVDAASPMEAVDAASPMEAVDAASPMEAVDAASPIEASKRSAEERAADPAAKARARLAVLPSPEERRRREEQAAADQRRRRNRFLFGAGSGSALALAAVALLALRVTVLAPADKEASPAPEAVSEAPRIFDAGEDEDAMQEKGEVSGEAAEGAFGQAAGDFQDAPEGGEGEGLKALLEEEAEPEAEPLAQPIGGMLDGLGYTGSTAGKAAETRTRSPRPRPSASPRPRPRPEPGPSFVRDETAKKEEAKPPPPPPPEASPAPIATSGSSLTRGGGSVAGGSYGAESDLAKDYRYDNSVADPAPEPIREAEEEAPEAPASTALDFAGGDMETSTQITVDDVVAETVALAKSPARDADVLEAKAKRAGRGGLRRQKADAGAVAEEGARYEVTDQEDAPADGVAAAAPEEQAPDLGSLRRAAMPSDLPGTPSSNDPAALAEYKVVQTAADAYVSAGEPRQAASKLADDVGAPAQVGMAQAARSAELYLQVGAYSEAASISRSGLALSTSNSAWRSLLFVRLGDALRGLGDEAGAQAAYESAIALNAAR